MFYPVAKPHLTNLEKRFMNESFDSSWISSQGKFIDLFEKNFSRTLGIKNTLLVSNGTVALQLALLTLGVKSGDEVIVPSFTYISCVNAILYVGAKPVFVDIDPKNWTICVNNIEKKITKKTKCIIAIHIYGQICELNKLLKLKRKYKIHLIEDCAESHFGKYQNKYLGTFGDISTFSFFGNKIISSGEGGAICLNNNNLYKKAKIIRNQGMSEKIRFYFPIIGHNFRISNILASILYGQFKRRNFLIFERKKIFKEYISILSKYDFFLLKELENYSSYWLFSIQLNKKYFKNIKPSRDKLLINLRKNGIDTRPFFLPIHKMPPYKKFFMKNSSRLANTDLVSYSGLNLPTYVGLRKIDIVKICSVLIKETHKLLKFR